jgi:hypothetical protein
MSASVTLVAIEKSIFERRLITVLSYGGTLPMMGCLLLIDSSWAQPLLKTYSLAIIAFLAGNWWSTALMQSKISAQQRQGILLISNAIVITAVITVTFMGKLALLVLALLFGLLLFGERILASFRPQPDYYRSMRTGVTALVIALHLSAFLLSP